MLSWKFLIASLRFDVMWPRTQKLQILHVTLLIIVTKGEWLWNSTKFFVVGFCSRFWWWPCTKHNSSLLLTEELTNRNVWITQLMYSVWTQMCINLGIFVYSFAVCRASHRHTHSQTSINSKTRDIINAFFSGSLILQGFAWLYNKLNYFHDQA